MDRRESPWARITSLALLTVITAAFAGSLAAPDRRLAAETAIETAARARCRAFIMQKADQAVAEGDLETARELDLILDDLSPPRRLAGR
jgi:hypothetical protein